MKYAIFDLDGTLVDSMSYWRGFGKAFLESKGFEVEDDIQQIVKANWVQGLCQLFKEKYNIEMTPAQLHDWAIDFVVDKYTTIVPFKGTSKELLDRLHQEGVKMCICSSTDRYMMEPALQRLDMLKYFQFTVHCRQFGKEKNEPDIFLHCIEQLGAKDPKEVVVFEDAVYSAQTAKNLGCYVVGIYDPTEPNQALLKEIADQYVTDYAQLDWDKLPK